VHLTCVFVSPVFHCQSCRDASVSSLHVCCGSNQDVEPPGPAKSLSCSRGAIIYEGAGLCPGSFLSGFVFKYRNSVVLSTILGLEMS
jgi:hypothetical protein